MFGTFGPRSGGRVYELGEGVASPKSKKVLLTPYSQVLCKVVSLMSLSAQYRQALSKLGCYYCGVLILEIDVFVIGTHNGLADD